MTLIVMTEATTLLYDAAASRAADAAAMTQIPVPGYELMQRAADAAFASLLQHYPGTAFITVFCGKGNNAGDAYLVAERAHRYGLEVQLIAVVDPAELTGDAALAYRDAVGAGVEVATEPDAIVGEVIIDGLLGTGLNGAPREPFKSAISTINALPQPVLSIDIPSGVSADTGAVYGEAVRADVCVSFITRKIGLYTGAGVSHAGIREFARLGVPDGCYAALDGVPLLTWRPEMLPELDANTYKHRQGHVLVVGGDHNMPGAVCLAAEAALRAGAGMVTVATRPQHAAAIVARVPEAMVIDAAEADAVLDRCDLVALGPGLGREQWGEDVYRWAAAAAKPTVLDADGLHWLSAAGSWPGGPLVMTPHVAEAAKLIGVDAAEVQQNRLQSAAELRQRYAACGVLKGAGSIVFTPDNLAVVAHGNPGMATAGMGDVLTGVVAGLLAPAADDAEGRAWHAALHQAVALHSAAADVAAGTVGMRSLLAGDVIRALPQTLQGHG